MYNKIKAFIVQLLEKKGTVPYDDSIDDYAFFDNGHIDSLGLMQFLVVIEQEFDIELSEEDIVSKQFRTVSGLTSMIETKLKQTV